MSAEEKGNSIIATAAVSFCEFLSGFVKIFNMEFSLIKHLIFWKKILLVKVKPITIIFAKIAKVLVKKTPC